MNATVLCIQGSLGRPSRTATLVELACRLLQRAGARTDVLDVRNTILPLVDPWHHDDPVSHPDPAVRNVALRVRSADAFVWASPVYHNSYSGALKNVLDHLNIEDFRDKPIALCGNGGRRASTQPSDHLRIVARGLHGIAIPLCVISSNADFVTESAAQFRIADTALVTRTAQMCAQLLDYVDRHRPLSRELTAVADHRRGGVPFAGTE